MPSLATGRGSTNAIVRRLNGPRAPVGPNVPAVCRTSHWALPAVPRHRHRDGRVEGDAGSMIRDPVVLPAEPPRTSSMVGKPGKRVSVSPYPYGPLPGVNLPRSIAQAIFASFPFLPATVWSDWLETGRVSTAFGSTAGIESVLHGMRGMPTISRLPTTTESTGRTRPSSGPAARRLPACRPPTHPGGMLLEEFLKPLGISQSAFARRLGFRIHGSMKSSAASEA